MLTAKRVTVIKTPPGFVGNVRCGCVTMGICMETASYSGIIKGGGGGTLRFSHCYLVMYLPSYIHFILLY